MNELAVNGLVPNGTETRIAKLLVIHLGRREGERTVIDHDGEARNVVAFLAEQLPEQTFTRVVELIEAAHAEASVARRRSPTC